MQVASKKFHELASGSVVPLSVRALLSFDKKKRVALNWFTLDKSALDGSDLLATAENNPAQVWDAYVWRDVSERLIDSVNVERSVAFPYAVQSAVADISLNNYDGFYTFADDGGSSPVAGFMLPRRPLRVYMGMKGAESLPVFVGLTQGMPEYTDEGDSVKFTAIDFLSEIGDQGLRETIKMRDVSTDKVIAEILKQYGLSNSQFKFSAGQNVIPFVMFKKDDKAGDVLRKLVQAENGQLWIDELGVVRFATRSGVLGKMPVMILDKSNILSIKPARESGIINRVKIKSEVREVQDRQPVFQLENKDGWKKEKAEEDQYRIKARDKLDIWLSISDPVWEVEDIKNMPKGDTSSIQVVGLNGAIKYNAISWSGTLFQDSYKLTVNNNLSEDISIAGVEIWGKPAKVVDVIDYEAYNDVSVEKFGVKSLEITDNNFFGSYRNADLLAMDILKKQSEYSPSLDLSIKGNPALQLGDIVTLDYKYKGDYLVEKIAEKISASDGLETEITIRKQQTVKPFILDVSKLNSTDVLG